MVVAPNGFKPVGRTLYDVWSVDISELYLISIKRLSEHR